MKLPGRVMYSPDEYWNPRLENLSMRLTMKKTDESETKYFIYNEASLKCFAAEIWEAAFINSDNPDMDFEDWWQEQEK
jgi:hypothetical protein